VQVKLIVAISNPNNRLFPNFSYNNQHQHHKYPDIPRVPELHAAHLE